VIRTLCAADGTEGTDGCDRKTAVANSCRTSSRP
jgi:hypothetical protein